VAESFRPLSAKGSQHVVYALGALAGGFVYADLSWVEAVIAAVLRRAGGLPERFADAYRV